MIFPWNYLSLWPSPWENLGSMACGNSCCAFTISNVNWENIFNCQKLLTMQVPNLPFPFPEPMETIFEAYTAGLSCRYVFSYNDVHGWNMELPVDPQNCPPCYLSIIYPELFIHLGRYPKGNRSHRPRRSKTPKPGDVHRDPNVPNPSAEHVAAPEPISAQKLDSQHKPETQIKNKHIFTSKVCDVNHVTSCHASRIFTSKVCDVSHVTSCHASRIFTSKVCHVSHVASCHASRIFTSKVCDVSHVTSCHASRIFTSKVCGASHVASCHASRIFTSKVCDVSHVASCHASRIFTSKGVWCKPCRVMPCKSHLHIQGCVM